MMIRTTSTRYYGPQIIAFTNIKSYLLLNFKQCGRKSLFTS